VARDRLSIKKPKPNATSADADKDGIVLRSDDGRLFYWLRATRAGLWVQRDRWRHDSRARLVQSHVFCSNAAFARWCDAYTVRFDYPIVFSKLQREGRALLNGHEHRTNAAADHPAG
jgi:hypothetical protein